MLGRPDAVKAQRLGQVSDGQSRFYALVIGRGRSMLEIPALETIPVLGVVREDAQIHSHS